MIKEQRLIPNGDKVTLDELLPGTIFAFGDDCIAVKSEYRCNNGLVEAFIIDSGEQFWGGVDTVEEQLALIVQPLAIKEVDAEKVVHGRWIRRGNEMKCSNPKCQFIYYSNHDDFNYCPNCGAKMDGERREGE